MLLPVDLLPVHDIVAVAAAAAARLVLVSADWIADLAGLQAGHRHSSMDHTDAGQPRCDCAKQGICGPPIEGLSERPLRWRCLRRALRFNLCLCDTARP